MMGFPFESSVIPFPATPRSRRMLRGLKETSCKQALPQSEETATVDICDNERALHSPAADANKSTPWSNSGMFCKVPSLRLQSTQ